jgi:uncharacterized protein YfaS (alpha-2-macroglobulin family)
MSARKAILTGAAAALAAIALATAAQQRGHDPAQHKQEAAGSGKTQPVDTRQAVQFPPQLREHTLANMRDHLLALQQMQEALSRNDYDGAEKTAEARLGMSSLTAHGAHEVARYMPKGMQDAGTAMHRSASRFAVSLQEASITGDLRKPLAELATVTASCVACHAGYRLK